MDSNSFTTLSSVVEKVTSDLSMSSISELPFGVNVPLRLKAQINQFRSIANLDKNDVFQKKCTFLTHGRSVHDGRLVSYIGIFNCDNWLYAGNHPQNGSFTDNIFMGMIISDKKNIGGLFTYRAINKTTFEEDLQLVYQCTNAYFNKDFKEHCNKFC
jgi:hypothetical protein